MPLVLKMDPTSIEAGSARAEAALKGVKTGAAQAESAIDMMAAAGKPMFGPINREGSAARATFDALQRSMNPAIAAAERFKNASIDISTALRAQVITQEEAALAMDMLTKQGTSSLLQAVALNGNQIAELGHIMRSTAGTMLAGGSAMQALGYEANRLVSVLTIGQGGPVAALKAMGGAIYGFLGAPGLAAVAIGALGLALYEFYPRAETFDQALAKATTANEEFGKSFSALKSDMEEAKTLQSDYVAAMMEGNAKLMQATAAQFLAQRSILQLDQIDAKAKLETDLKANQALADAQRRTFDEQISRINQMTALKAQEAEIRAGGAGDLAEVIAAEGTVQAVLNQNSAALNEQTAALKRSNAELDVSKTKFDAINLKIGTIGGLLDGIVKIAPGATWLSTAIAQVEKLAGAFWAARTAAGVAGAAAAPGSAANIAYQYGQYGIGHAAASAATNPLYNPPPPPVVATGGGGGGGGGGGASQIDQTQQAYDSLMASLDPVVARTQDMAKAQAVVNAEMASGQITSAQAANAMDLIAKKYGEATDSMSAFKDAGASAIDRLIAGTGSLKDALRDMIKQMELAIIKNTLLAHVTGGTSSMGIGSLLMQGLFGGFHADGGTIPAGTTGVVGERGPELITAGANPINVTSNASMRAMGQQAMHITVGVAVDDSGNLKAYVRNVAQAAGAQAVSTVRRSLAGWNGQLATDGALV